MLFNGECWLALDPPAVEGLGEGGQDADGQDPEDPFVHKQGLSIPQSRTHPDPFPPRKTETSFPSLHFERRRNQSDI